MFKSKFLSRQPNFSRSSLLVYVLIFGVIGGYLIWRSYAASSPLPRPDHVVVVVEENHIASAIVGSSNAPYMNSLINQGALLVNSQAITHPSQPNYLELFSGSNQGVSTDGCPKTLTAANLGSELMAAGQTFVGYSEDLPGVGSKVCSSGNYERKHAPWVNFTNIPDSANQPFSNFPSDYTKLPSVAFVTPNMQHDMHDGTVAQADSWLKANLDGYVQWAKTHNSVLILTTDEGRNANQNIATFFVGQPVKTGSYTQTVDHHDVLRTLEDMYSLPHAGASANATPITDTWVGSTTPPPPPPPPPTADKTPPTVSMTAPANGITVKGTVQLKATAADDVGVASLQFKLDGASGGDLGPQLTAAPYTYDWDTTSATDGNYVLTATAADAAGNQTTAATVTVTVANGGSGGGTGGAVGGDINISDGKSWICSAPVNLNRVIISNPTGNGAYFRAGCTGTINYLEITGTTHDALHINTGSHDILVKSGKIRCAPKSGTVHQDGIQAMGGGPVTFQNMDVQCITANNAALFINSGINNNSIPTGIVCDNCIINTGTLYPVRIYTSKDSGVKNSTIYKGTKDWINISSGAINPIDQNNKKLECPITRTINCDGSTDDTAPPPPPAPVVSLSATSLSDTTSTSTITWSSTNATSCTGSGGTTGWSGSKPTSGTYDTGPTVQEGMTFSLTCSNSSGSTTKTVTIQRQTPPPPPSTDTTPPTVSMTAPAGGANVSGASVTVSANASDNVGVAGVQFKLDGSSLGALDTTSPYSTTWNTTTLGNGSHTLTAVASDAAGNSATATSVTVNVNNPVPPPSTVDTTAPSVPTGLHLVKVTRQAAVLAWNASTDKGGSGLGGYAIYRDGNYIAYTNLLTYKDTNLKSGTTYKYKVAAYDNALNVSAKSSALSVTTNSGTTTTAIPGDVNGDGHVDATDYSICLDLYNKDPSNLRCDFNKDGRLDVLDYDIFVENYGT